MFGVAKGSILGKTLLIIFFSDLFSIYKKLLYTSYADDTTYYVCRQNHVDAIEFLEPTLYFFGSKTMDS